jgi:hypothetical protein
MNGISMDASLRSVASQRSISRRRFLWDVARTTAATSVFGLSAFGQSPQRTPAFRSESKYRKQDRIGSKRHFCEADGKAWSGVSLTPYPAHHPDTLNRGASHHVTPADRVRSKLANSRVARSSLVKERSRWHQSRWCRSAEFGPLLVAVRAALSIACASVGPIVGPLRVQ